MFSHFSGAHSLVFLTLEWGLGSRGAWDSLSLVPALVLDSSLAPSGSKCVLPMLRANCLLFVPP